MSQNDYIRNQNFSQFDEYDDEEEGILSKTGSFISSLFSKVINTINPFKSKKNVQNPYDLNSKNDPCNYLNNFDNINNNKNNLFISSPNPYNNNNQNIYDQNLNRSSQIYLGNNNFDEIPNNQNKDNLYINDDYLTVDDLCQASPHLKEEIFKDIKRPNYIPNEEIFQKAKKFVYENLIKKYKIMKPRSTDKTFGESVLLLSIQLTNKYNIEKQYDYLVNNKRNINYRLEINVPEIIKNYYTNKAKTLLYENINDNSEKISDYVNKEFLNKLSGGIIFNEKDKDNDANNLNNSKENRLICRTPKTKRNYLTCLFESKYNYDYLCPNDKEQCKIYRECLLYKENELRNYARVIEVTNNMFKFICNENEKLRDLVKEKEEKVEKFAQQIVLDKIKNNEEIQKLQNEIKDLKNKLSEKNSESLQNINDNNNLINKNINIISQNSSFNNNIPIDNTSSKSSIFTLKKSYEMQHEFTFNSNHNNNNNNLISSQKTATFNNKSTIFSNSSKNNNISNSVLMLKSQSIDKNDSQKNNENKESDQKVGFKLFSFIQSDEKKEENENKSKIDNNNDKKEEISNFNVVNSDKNKSKKKINFGFIDDKKEGNINNKQIDNNPININENKSKKINFGFISEEKNENEEQKEKEDKNEINNQNKNENKENNLNDTNEEKIKDTNEQKKEESSGKMNITLPETKEDSKNQEKTQQIILNKELNKESLNNPNNPFLSTVNIKINEEFSTNLLNEEKDKNRNDFSEQNSHRNTMDNTNTLIKLGDYSNIDNSNSNSFIIHENNNLLEQKNYSQTNPFSSNQNNNLNESKNPFMAQNNIQQDTSLIINNSNNNNSGNIFLNNNSNNNINTTSTFNTSINFNDKNTNNDITNNPFLDNNRNNTQNNNSNNNNPFVAFNVNNNGNNSLTRSQNPFISQPNTNATNIFNFNNEAKTTNNPFISNSVNTIINSTNTSNNNITNLNSQSNNPFLSFGNNNNNGAPNSNNLNSNNPFIKDDNLASSNSPIFGKNNFNDNNNSSTNNSNSLFSFKINAPEGSSKVNPFLSNKNGFDFGSSNNSNNAFAMGVNLKKPGGNSYISIFDDNKPRKIDGFFN